MFRYLNPEVPTFSRQSITRSVRALFEEKREELKAKLKTHIKGGGKVCLTEDGWSSNRRCPYLGVTIHFVERASGQIFHSLLAFRPFRGQHTADRLAAELASICIDYGISGDSIRSITADSEATNFAAFHKLERLLPGYTYQDTAVHCIAHAMNLSAQSILQVLRADRDQYKQISNQGIADDNTDEGPTRSHGNTLRSEADVAAIFRCIRKIVLKIKASDQLRGDLRLYCDAEKIEFQEPINDVGTRYFTPKISYTSC